MNSEKAKLYRFAYAKITLLCLLALFCAAVCISFANDLYAFVKPHNEVTLSIDASMTVKELALSLEREGIVANPNVFRLYVRSKGKETLLEKFQGTISLASDMSYREILIAFSEAST